MLSVKNLSLKKIKISPNKKEKEKKIKNMVEQIKRVLIKTFLLLNSNNNYKNLVIIILIKKFRMTQINYSLVEEIKAVLKMKIIRGMLEDLILTKIKIFLTSQE
jgi:hypothetical protein